ncbi:hypothetical protein DLR60_16170 [Vibrio tarriae]|nr:hypothetical protein DLR60_16170 [Vibrio tarriae]
MADSWTKSKCPFYRESGRPHNKRLKRDCQRVAFPVPMSRGGCSCCFEFGGMRCQPLRRALYECVRTVENITSPPLIFLKAFLEADSHLCRRFIICCVFRCINHSPAIISC